MPASPSPTFMLAFAALVVGCAGAFVALVFRAYRSRPSLEGRKAMTRVTAALIVLLFGTIFVAGTGALRRFDILPPPIMVGLLLLSGFNVWLFSFTTFGERMARGLPVWMIVAAQAFRLPVELLLHRGYTEGFIPVQMTWEGRNFDVATAILAIVLGIWGYARERGGKGDLPTGVVWAFNLVGLALLINVVTVAALSFPTPFQQFHEGPPNVWVTFPPYIWLPTVLVQFALTGHLISIRRLRPAAEG